MKDLKIICEDTDLFKEAVKKIIDERKRKERETGEEIMIAISSEEYNLILKKYGKDFMKSNNFINRDIVLFNPYKNFNDIKDLIK